MQLAARNSGSQRAAARDTQASLLATHMPSEESDP